MASNRANDIIRHLASRPGHDEVKAGIRDLLVTEFATDYAELDFEHRVPEVRGRIDALLGRTIFEAKRDLSRERRDAEEELSRYLPERERKTGERYVGIATDGLDWSVYEWDGEKVVEIRKTRLDAEKPDEFLAWLDGAVALKGSLAVDALTIRLQLGHESVAYRRASELLAAAWGRVAKEPTPALKRQLWAELLKLVHGKDVESDPLWFQHTFLVIVAKAIALVTLDVDEADPTRLLSGRAFTDAGIHGAVESDFFDWVLADKDGRELVGRIAAHVRRFRLRDVDIDVLKILYESLIDRDHRHGLGEYYTPDWLAAKIVRRAVTNPLEQRVLDPACGSGTFLFHAVRNFLTEAEDAGLPVEDRAAEATSHIAGMDIHPVAVIIARVTYLLALGPVLASRRGAISLPVYLGDALQLSVTSMMRGKELTIVVPPAADEPADKPKTMLSFPEALCRDGLLFDKLVAEMRHASEQGLGRERFEARAISAIEDHTGRGVPPEQKQAVGDLGATYLVFDGLRRVGRDSVWTYVARNLARPLTYSSSSGWANVLVGNPPWVAFRHMTNGLQKRFREMAKGERVYVGGKLATQNDLSALFFVSALKFYLRPAGRLAFVMPLAALRSGQFERLRSGSYSSARFAFDEVWTMDSDLQPLFPVPACVIFGRRRATSSPMPDTVTAYSGTLPLRDASEAIADRRLEVRKDTPRPTEASFVDRSPYRKAFRQGATLVPRVLCLVERKATGRLGANRQSPLVVSRRSTQEKRPWKDLPAVEHPVEAEFLRPVYLGESILPYRVFRAFEGVIPVDRKGGMLDAQAATNRGFDGLAGWMREAEGLWNKNAESSMTLVERWNYHNELGAQFPTPEIRVVYSKAGTLPAATIIRERKVVIDHKLYWATTASAPEAAYLVAILNSETGRKRVESLQSRGQWGARDFDKVMFTLPIPRFDETKALHRDLAAAAAEAEALAATLEIDPATRFQTARRRVRDALTEAGISPRIDRLVERLLGPA